MKYKGIKQKNNISCSNGMQARKTRFKIVEHIWQQDAENSIGT